MRYFDENTKQLIENPDTNLGKQSSTVENSMHADWIIDVPMEGHWEVIEVVDIKGKKVERLFASYKDEIDEKTGEIVVSEILENPSNADIKVGEPMINPENGGMATGVIDVEEEGHWLGSTTSVYGVEPDLDDPPTDDHTQHPIHIEKVALGHTYTQAELDEIAEQKALNDAKQEASQAKQDQLDNIALSGSQSVIDHDLASCDIYNLFPSANAISDTKPYSRAFGRRVERGEITIDDCPSALITEIQQILDNKGLATTTANATNGTVTGQGKSIMYPRNYNISLDLKPNVNYRVPTSEEFSLKSTISATNTSGQEISDFASKYIYYYESLGNGKLQITIPKDCKTISISVECIKITETSYTVNFAGERATFGCDGEIITQLTCVENTEKEVKIDIDTSSVFLVDVHDNEGVVYSGDEDNNITVIFTKNTTINAVTQEY